MRPQLVPLLSIVICLVITLSAQASDIDNILSDVNAMADANADSGSEIIDLAKSMIPLSYAAPTMAAICGVSPETGKEQIRKQIAANQKVVDNLSGEEKEAYLAEVRSFEARMKAEFDALPAEKQETECAALR